MYKLFLTLRYLTRKKIVLFPILAIWLCVMMMIIVASIMGGFVDRAQQVNRDLNGDIIISSHSDAGWPYYDELGAALQKKFPQIADWTPVVHGYGLINLPDYNATRGILVVGVDPVGRSKVSKFRQSLYYQYQAPLQAADDLAALGLPKTGEQLLHGARLRLAAAEDEVWKQRTAASALEDQPPHTPQPIYWALLGMIPVLALAWWALGPRRRRTVWSVTSSVFIFLAGSGIVTVILLWPLIFPAAFSLSRDAFDQATVASDRAYQTARFAADLDPANSYASRQQILNQILPKEPSFALPPDAQHDAAFSQEGCFVGAGFELFYRDRRGNFHRPREFTRAILTVVPISAGGSLSTIHAAERKFIIVDDFYSGVLDVDRQFVYAPFDTVQEMAGMKGTDPELVKENPASAIPARCNEILIKLQPGSTMDQINKTRDAILDFTSDFRAKHPDLRILDVQTWEEQQKTFLDAVRGEKGMMTFILLLMSGVVLVVIFLIFYQIVRDKTRDIGIIKAVGGSEEGVAAIFLSYGLFIGLVGGALGVLTGVVFVHHTNEIHELIFQFTGHMIWDRKVYLFDRIPDTVNPTEVAAYFILALIAGILGALLPAIVAGSEDPVKAVRYE